MTRLHRGEAALGRKALAAAIAALLVVAVGAGPVHAAAEVHRFNLVVSAIPTQLNGGDINDEIDFRNRALENQGQKGLDRIVYAFLFEVQLRYLMSPRFAVNAGVGQLRKSSEREFLPGLQQDVQLRWELFSVPVSVGADYYLAPYNQGDFQARAYVGGGFLSTVQNRLLYQQTEIGVPNGVSFVSTAKRDAPGFYVEGGVHMFFATRFSVLLGLVFRSAKVEALLDKTTNEPRLGATDQKPLSMDLSGVGGRMALAFGF
ncbi:MAG TPA: outer membrane beta-barrel protein [Candidatus Eisenbacteria bacterium]|jgi:hypothetical protein